MKNTNDEIPRHITLLFLLLKYSGNYFIVEVTQKVHQLLTVFHTCIK